MISERAIGKLPISIATSLAIERAIGIHDEFSDPKPIITEYQELWINLKTLFRNLFHALDKDAAKLVLGVDLAGALIDEMNMIVSVIDEYSSSKVKVVFYVSNYNDLDVYYKLGKVRTDNTEIQKEYTLLMKQAIGKVLKVEEQSHSHDIRTFELSLKTEKRHKVLLVTHYPIDLLSSKTFTHLDLLESHTGNVLGKALWYKKYHDGKDLAQIPFNGCFIQIFGDKETFKPYPIAVRRDILEIAKRYNWSSVSTDDKIRYGLKELKDPYTRELMLSIVNA